MRSAQLPWYQTGSGWRFADGCFMFGVVLLLCDIRNKQVGRQQAGVLGGNKTRGRQKQGGRGALSLLVFRGIAIVGT